MSYNWNWSIFFEPAPGGTGTYFHMLLTGLWLTIQTGVFAWIIALLFGSVIGVLRTLPSKTAYWVGFAYVEFFRNMPLLVQLFLWFFVLPELPMQWPGHCMGGSSRPVTCRNPDPLNRKAWRTGFSVPR